MKILTATTDTQGQRDNDFSYTLIGEPIRFGMDCDHQSIDGPCGCKRSMVGALTHKSTTTMKVVESPYTPEEYVRLIKKSINDAWGITSDDTIGEHIKELIRTASAFPTGSIVERRGDTFRRRKVRR